MLNRTRLNRKEKSSLIMPNKMYLFALPALILFCVFWVFPVFQLFYYSITNFNGINPNYSFVGISNYQKILSDGSVINSAKNTLVYTIINVIGANIIGLALAMALNSKIRAKGLFRTAVYIPALFSAVVVGFIWSYVYMPDAGMIASLLKTLGINTPFNILGNYKTALYGITIVDIWKNVGTTMIIYLAGLQTLDDSQLEAGRIDGCNEWQLIFKIKLPLITSTITINVILSVIAGLKAFDYPFIMTNGGPGKSTRTLMFDIYQMAFNSQQMGKASAFSVIAFLLIIIITISMLIFMNKREVEL